MNSVLKKHDKSQKIELLLQRAASEFLARESNRQSLITVTSVRLSQKTRRAEICVTIFPEKREEQALDFLKRKKGEFSEFLSDRARLQYLPKIEFVLDAGEKNRQRIDELLRNP